MSDAARRHRLWGLAPHGLSLAAFATSFAIVAATGSNRLDSDFYAGVAGYGFGLIALLSTLLALIAHPWRRGGGWHWLALSCHVALLGLVALAGSTWLAIHIA